MAELTHNNQNHSATKTSPFQLVYGYNPDFTIHPGQNVVPAADERMRELAQAREEAQAALEVAADRMKQQYDKRV